MFKLAAEHPSIQRTEVLIKAFRKKTAVCVCGGGVDRKGGRETPQMEGERGGRQ
jgi:hypothetical protein